MEWTPATHADPDRHISADPPILSLQTEPVTVEFAHRCALMPSCMRILIGSLQ